jgi:Secretion system C-terminal sorting domain
LDNRRDAINRVSTEVSVVNSIGQTVFQQKTNGETTLRVDVSTWARGVYFVKTSSNTEGVKFVKE